MFEENVELKLIISLLLKELRNYNSEIGKSNTETIKITQLKQINSILVKEVAESRIEIEKLKGENESLKSDQGSKNASEQFQSLDDQQKNQKRKRPNSSSNAWEITFLNATNNDDSQNENIEEKAEQENFIGSKIFSNITISDNDDLNNEICEKNESHYCYLCEKIFLDEHHLNLHCSAVHEGNNESMKDDKKENQNIETFIIKNIYDKNQPKNVCHICDQKFCHSRSKRKHLKTMHNVETHYSCDNCDKSFPNFNHLQKHKKEHFKKEKDADNTSKVACHICGKMFHSIRYMKSHVRDVHQESYKCRECGISFTRVELNKHISTIHRS